MAQEAQVSSLAVRKGGRIADLTAGSAVNFGVTREINTTGRYAITQRWAAALRLEGFCGSRYEARLSTAAAALSLALFGRAGQADWPDDANREAEPTRRRELGSTPCAAVRSLLTKLIARSYVDRYSGLATSSMLSAIPQLKTHCVAHSHLERRRPRRRFDGST
jgi:hypothetical protein